jgi:hypothetical protein
MTEGKIYDSKPNIEAKFYEKHKLTSQTQFLETIIKDANPLMAISRTSKRISFLKYKST